MPFMHKIEDVGFALSLWRIEEDIAFFANGYQAPEILHESKRLQWYASRHLVNQLMGRPVEVAKDPHGRPYIADEKVQISLSHTSVYAAAMVSSCRPVGVDLEMINPKVERIGHKFLKEDELHAIAAEERIEKLILYWSAKEALYKLYGRRQVDFKSHLLIEPFALAHEGVLRAAISLPAVAINNLAVHYRFFDDHVLTYVVNV